MTTVSWVFWFAWMAAGLAYELYAVTMEHRNGALPLTRVVRDRLARRFVVVKLGLALFIVWFALHMLTPLSW